MGTASPREVLRQSRHFHWQNLNEKPDGTTGSGFKNGRCWWHLLTGTIGLEWHLWGSYFGLAMVIGDDDVTISLGIPPVSLYLNLDTRFPFIAPILPRRKSDYYPDLDLIDEREIGIRVHSGVVWINLWSRKNEFRSRDPWWIRGMNFSINPFEWTFVRHEVLAADGWKLRSNNVMDKSGPAMQTENFSYRYVLKNGQVQNRTATVGIERRAWRPRCLKWTSLFEKVSTVIDVRFSDEVGERTGSWKGGCIGCGYDLLPGESAEQCLRRMEKERKF